MIKRSISLNLASNAFSKLAAFTCSYALCGCLLTLSPQTLSADYYRWVDENGTVHFSEKPPKGNIKAEKHRTVIPVSYTNLTLPTTHSV